MVQAKKEAPMKSKISVQLPIAILMEDVSKNLFPFPQGRG